MALPTHQKRDRRRRTSSSAASAMALLLAAAAAALAPQSALAAGRGLLGAQAANGAKAATDAKSADGAAAKQQYGYPYGGYGGGGGGLYGGPGLGSGYRRGNGFGNNGFGNNGLGGGPNAYYGQWGGGNPYQGGGRPPGMNNREWRRYNRDLLRGVRAVRSPPQWSGPAPGPLSPNAARLSGAFASADASSLARDFVGGPRDVVAEGIVDAAARGRGPRLAEAMASAAALNRGATAGALTRSASYAVARGQVDPFADAAGQAFIAAKRRGTVRPLGLAMAEAVSEGGDYGAYMYGKAIAKAVAGGGDGQAAVAEATAEVFCAGGQYASAWSQAFAIALNQDENGCLVLSNARAMAQASCGGGAFNANSDSDSTSTVLGFCGLFAPGAGPQFSFNSADGGSSSWGGYHRRLAEVDEVQLQLQPQPQAQPSSTQK